VDGAAFPWRLLDEPTPGVNFARNLGIRKAAGDLLIFVDSDLRFTTAWLQAYAAAAERHPGEAVFAGRVHVGDIDGDSEGPGPVGPNMAFRRSVFERFGPFDTRFGLRPGSFVPGAEAEYFDRLGRA
jgi:glucosyl-dolichyl phosphate glucuronosyltransferase